MLEKQFIPPLKNSHWQECFPWNFQVDLSGGPHFHWSWGIPVCNIAKRLPLVWFSYKLALPANELPGTSSEGPLNVLTSGTYRGSSRGSQGTNTKFFNFMIKLYFISNRPCIMYLFLVFAGGRNIQKF